MRSRELRGWGRVDRTHFDRKFVIDSPIPPVALCSAQDDLEILVETDLLLNLAPQTRTQTVSMMSPSENAAQNSDAVVEAPRTSGIHLLTTFSREASLPTS